MKNIPLSPKAQGGAAALLITLMLLIGVTLVSFYGTRTAVVEQRIANNEYRGIEAQQAAQAGLDFAIAWLSTNNWATGNAVPVVPPITAGNGDTYTPTLAFSEVGPSGEYIEITATATAASDASRSATANQVLFQRTLLTPAGANAPPLVINGCLSGVGGNPTIYPDPGPPVGNSLATSQGAGCIDYGHFKSREDDGSPGQDPEVAQTTQGNAFEGSAWDHIFDISQSDFIDAATAVPDSDSLPGSFVDGTWDGATMMYVTDGDNWNSSAGSADKPVIIFIAEEAGCPKFNGGPVIYGFVYFEAHDACNTHGWGNATIYGSVIHEGDITKHTANTEFRDWKSLSGGGGPPNPVLAAGRLVGTWKDF